MPHRQLRRGGAALAALVFLAACVNTRPDPNGPRTESTAQPGRGTAEPTSGLPEGLLLSSGFERPVCGSYVRPDPGCEFGIQGDVETGPFGARTGESCARIGRVNPVHVGVIALVPLPEGHAFIGVAHRVPAIPAGAIPAEPGYLEIEDLSPTDGVLPGWPVEVRLYPDRRLGLALFRGTEVALTDWRVPLDEWFYVVVEVANGEEATQRMWVYDSQDEVVAKVSIGLDTRVDWPHADRIAHKIGGNTSTLVPMSTCADDWYISTSFRGPMRIGPDGSPLSP
ncbi:MAG: hypothetical protein ACT4PO_05815 [Actinomycetota bacterium]